MDKERRRVAGMGAITKKILIKIIAAGLAVIIIAAAAVIGFGALKGKKSEPEILTESMLYKVADVSNLSTYQCVYNAICVVYDEAQPEQIDFYCAYDAKVNAGIDFEKVVITKDSTNKTISVTIPPIQITDVAVDIASLDYIFEDKQAETATVSERAYKACIADVQKKSEEENKIYELAEKNAVDVLSALLKPFVEQFDSEYMVEVKVSEVD